jgi:hypothetical protein
MAFLSEQEKVDMEERANRLKLNEANDRVLWRLGGEPFPSRASDEAPEPPIQEQTGPKPPPASLVWGLRHEAQHHAAEYEKKRRAVELLERHPEFEELRELLTLVPIY